MKTDELKNINQILEQVLEFDEAKRLEFFENRKISREVRAEVEELLSFQAEADGFLSLSARDLTNGFFTEKSKEKNSQIGQKIGIYKIIKELGFGGMGAVYLAERIDEKFSQKVTIKMLRREFNTEKIRKRFRLEREIQARLVHPNIATLLDAGTTDDGIPYLVMEYVEGTRIDNFCNENNLKLNERLKLFNKVCEAVSFAHRNLIIHRDIKPSNILVTKKGEPKLLDFGISKLINESGENTKTMTMLGAMTPEYASPEQIKGESVTTATDVYSLGVVLFKLLTGTMPYNTSNKPNTDIFREITNAQPTTPSEAISRQGDTETRRGSESVKERKGEGEIKDKTTQLPPHSLTHSLTLPIAPSLLKGDLDNIILKTLRKEPERRYKTVEQLSADIWRFIDGLPVLARPATFSYRARKFYGRNKIQVLASVFIALSLIAGISIAVWQAREAREQARIADAAQRKAEAEAEKSKAEEERAKKITKFMENIISYANPHQSAEGYKSGGEAKVIDVLNELRDKIETEFPSEPDIQAELHHKFSEVYTIRKIDRQRGKEKEEPRRKAVYHAKKALELRKKYYGEKHELVAKDMYYLWASLGDDQFETEEINKYELIAEAVQMMRETNRNNLNLPYMLSDYANRWWGEEETTESQENYYKYAIPKPNVGRLELAEKYYMEAKPLFEAAYPEDHSAIHPIKCQLGMLRIMMEKYKEAKNYFEACRILEKQSKMPEWIIKRNDEYAEKLEKGLNE